MDTLFHIPNRFESIAGSGLEQRPLIVPVQEDLEALDRLRRMAQIQGGGVLVFLLAPSGAGKTTAVHAASAHMSEAFEPVFAVPPEIGLRAAAAWLTEHLPSPTGKARIVLLDGREVTDDNVGLRQFLSSLNQLLRRRRDLIVCWPTTDSDWHEEIKRVAATIGGSSLVPTGADVRVQGPPRSEWVGVLDRILIQRGLTLADTALEPSQVQLVSLRDDVPLLGTFLGEVGGLIANRIPSRRVSLGLPALRIVISSGHAITGEANRLRRAGGLLLKAEELLAYSGRSDAGKWWRARLEQPEQHLAYVISLLDARLLTLSASAVCHSALLFGAEELRAVVEAAGCGSNRGNARRAMLATDCWRFFEGQEVWELTSTKKGSPAQTTRAAFAALQRLSATHHKALNQGIVSLLCEHHTGERRLAEAQFELASSGGDIVADCVVEGAEQDQYLEFHHLSERRCKAARIASYILEKLRAYAVAYNLTPR